MSKTHLEVYVNSNMQDCIITHCMRTQVDPSGKPLFTDKESNIAKEKGSVLDIKIYVRDDNDYRNVSLVSVSPTAIRMIYDAMKEIEEKEGEGFVEF